MILEKTAVHTQASILTGAQCINQSRRHSKSHTKIYKQKGSGKRILTVRIQNWIGTTLKQKIIKKKNLLFYTKNYTCHILSICV